MKLVQRLEEQALREFEAQDKFSMKVLEEREGEIVQGIMRIAREGKPSDSVRLKAYTTLWNKIRSDKKTPEVEGQSSPGEIWQWLLELESRGELPNNYGR